MKKLLNFSSESRQNVPTMMSRLEIAYLPDPTKWVAVSDEEPRVVKAGEYKALADQLNKQRIGENAVVCRPVRSGFLQSAISPQP